MFNKISKNLRAVVALPFVIVAMGLLLLYWFFISINRALVYVISFLVTIGHFIYHGEWKWNAILEEVYDDLWRLWWD
ncbi:hypothetical protein NSA18_11140 [Pasteurella caecimuris]|uniref:hypothetical protein n=1 Tax=Rodentibacter caecimuris TaxID=1796644 RepID=UPI00214FCEF2|nr:hypothetical protein [Pasteurella caecimuris]MCR1838436.1 hypothetical protein [Pasteurella caecimuris]MCU0107728.1 hypothetical protein [Pasteurella caecimuris]